MLFYHFMAKFEVDINSIDSLTHKSDWHLILLTISPQITCTGDKNKGRDENFKKL